MKVEVNERPTNKESQLMKCKTHDLIVLATKFDEVKKTFWGTVLSEHNTDRYIGEIDYTWNTDSFDVFHGNVTLSND